MSDYERLDKPSEELKRRVREERRLYGGRKLAHCFQCERTTLHYQNRCMSCVHKKEFLQREPTCPYCGARECSH